MIYIYAWWLIPISNGVFSQSFFGAVPRLQCSKTGGELEKSLAEVRSSRMKYVW